MPPRIVRWFTILGNLPAQSAPAITRAQRLRTLSDRLFGKRRDTGIVALLIALLEIGVAVGVYLTGGTQFVYLQFMYIPVALAGRILTVLDVFEALTSKRPYREPMLAAEALHVIQADRDTRFDSSIVDAFVMLYNSGQLALSIVNDARVAQLHDRYGSGALLLSRLQLIKS